MKKNYDIVPRNDGWAVEREGAHRASGLYESKQQAFERGRDLAIAARGELRIHGRDGKIQNSNSYGNDPFPPRDTKH